MSSKFLFSFKIILRNFSETIAKIELTNINPIAKFIPIPIGEPSVSPSRKNGIISERKSKFQAIIKKIATDFNERINRETAGSIDYCSKSDSPSVMKRITELDHE